MELADNDERLEYAGIADPYMDLDCNPDDQTGSDWFALALTASLGGRAVHGHTFATTTETLGKTTYEFAAKHTVGWVRTNEPILHVDQPGDEWDELVRPTRLHTGVVTGAQLSLMFDTDNWEPSGAARARNTAFLAAGMVTNGCSVDQATQVAGKISGEEVPESAIMNTVVPVSHLKREAAGVAKASHAIFSRMNAQRYISWNDTQLHQGVLPDNASLDWAKVTVVGRYLAEANMRYDPVFRKLARVGGVPYTIVKGSWAYVGKEDYILPRREWNDVPVPNSSLVKRGSLAKAYTEHTARLTTQIMRTYNELASTTADNTVEALLKLAENLRTRRTVKTSTIAASTDTLAQTRSHQQSAAIAASITASSGTSHNALVQAFSEFALADRSSESKASYIVSCGKHYEALLEHLGPFITVLASRHTWVRAFDLLNHMLQNPRTALDRMNRLHRSVTQSSQTIEVDAPMTSRAKHSMAPHAYSLLKKALIRPGPQVAIPRYVTSVSQSVARGEHAQLLRAIGDHLTEYKTKWADRYEDWARVYAVAKTDRRKSILYGAAATAFRKLSAGNVMSPGSQFVDGANVKASYLYSMALDYARKRRLAKPVLPAKPISGGAEYADLLDRQYNADVTFKEVLEFVTPKLAMFAEDLNLGLEPMLPTDDEPIGEDAPKPEEEIDYEALLAEMEGEVEDFDWESEAKIASSYPANVDPDKVARANNYDDFAHAVSVLGQGARYDTDTDYTRVYLANSGKGEEEAADEVMF